MDRATPRLPLARAEALALDAVDPGPSVAVPTGVAEFDRALSGGLVPGSVTLIGGEPGIGKSTLLLQLAGAVARSGRRVLYVTGEESPQQVRLRADRLDVVGPGVHLLPETAVPGIIASLDDLAPDLLLIDSIQTLHEPELSAAPGSVGQVRACTHRLTIEAKARSLPTVLVGGQIGSWMGAERINSAVIKKLTALLILYVSIRLLFRFWMTP